MDENKKEKENLGSSPRCYFFGCWNEPGHYLRPAATNPPEDRKTRRAMEYFRGSAVHFDGSLAPRQTESGAIVWYGSAATQDGRRRTGARSAECPEGWFLLHHLDTGFTAIQWWDRQQGDRRPGCNSTVMLEGRHSAAEMVAALERHFPSVLERLRNAGVALVEVHLEKGEKTDEK